MSQRIQVKNKIKINITNYITNYIQNSIIWIKLTTWITSMIIKNISYLSYFKLPKLELINIIPHKRSYYKSSLFMRYYIIKFLLHFNLTSIISVFDAPVKLLEVRDNLGHHLILENKNISNLIYIKNLRYNTNQMCMTRPDIMQIKYMQEDLDIKNLLQRYVKYNNNMKNIIYMILIYLELDLDNLYEDSSKLNLEFVYLADDFLSMDKKIIAFKDYKDKTINDFMIG